MSRDNEDDYQSGECVRSYTFICAVCGTKWTFIRKPRMPLFKGTAMMAARFFEKWHTIKGKWHCGDCYCREKGIID